MVMIVLTQKCIKMLDLLVLKQFTMTRGKSRPAKWPCGSCKKECKTQCVYCDLCETWFHADCENIDSVTLNLFSSSPEAYICHTCRSDEGDFDYLHGMERLKKAASQSMEKLKTVAKRELLLMGSEFVYMNKLPITDLQQKLSIDTLADNFLSKYTFEENHRAAQATGDGDCLFNSASTLLNGNESLSIELRFKTCLEMATNETLIKNHQHRSSYMVLSPDYNEACKNCAGFGSRFSCIWTIRALANVIRIPIKVLYPAINGCKDLAFVKFNTTFQPTKLPTLTVEPLKIMWSSTYAPSKGKCWTPNHFVPVVPQTYVHSASRVVSSTPSDLNVLRDRALVEYCGENDRTLGQPHGNSKNTEPYTRTDPKILKDCAVQSKSKSATEVCFLAAKDNSIMGPKSSRQIRDKIYRENKKERVTSQSSQNIAEEVLNIISQIHSSSVIQKIEIGKNKLPNIILYTKEQISDLISNCAGEGGSTLGIDRTFNLGKCFVTAFTYKNQGVVQRTTNEHPIMLGPLLLHWDGEMATYQSFFSHIRTQIGTHRYTIGTDEERAMTNALQDCFHNATFLLCTKHIQDNLNRFLEKTGTSQKLRNQIRNTIFAEDGIVFSQDDVEYRMRMENLAPHFEQNNKFQQYWDRYLEQKLKKFVIQPLQKNIIKSLWTNNNAESMNNRLKQVAQWKQHRLPELTEKMALVSQIQFLDLRRALHGTGNYKLTPEFKLSFLFDQQSWIEKSSSEKEKIFQKFLKTKKTTHVSKFVRASNTDFICPKPKQSCGKKPGQRKRTKSAKTTTVKFQKT